MKHFRLGVAVGCSRARATRWQLERFLLLYVVSRAELGYGVRTVSSSPLTAKRWQL